MTSVILLLSGRATLRLDLSDSGVQALIHTSLLGIYTPPHYTVIPLFGFKAPCESFTQRTRGSAEIDNATPAPPPSPATHTHHPLFRDSDYKGTIKGKNILVNYRVNSPAPGDKPHLSDESLTPGAQPPANHN